MNIKLTWAHLLVFPRLLKCILAVSSKYLQGFWLGFGALPDQEVLSKKPGNFYEVHWIFTSWSGSPIYFLNLGTWVTWLLLELNNWSVTPKMYQQIDLVLQNCICQTIHILFKIIKIKSTDWSVTPKGCLSDRSCFNEFKILLRSWKWCIT